MQEDLKWYYAIRQYNKSSVVKIRSRAALDYLFLRRIRYMLIDVVKCLVVLNSNHLCAGSSSNLTQTSGFFLQDYSRLTCKCSRRIVHKQRLKQTLLTYYLFKRPISCRAKLSSLYGPRSAPRKHRKRTYRFELTRGNVRNNGCWPARILG